MRQTRSAVPADSFNSHQAGARFGVPCEPGRHQLLVEQPPESIYPYDVLGPVLASGYKVDEKISDHLSIVSCTDEQFLAGQRETEEKARRNRMAKPGRKHVTGGDGSIGDESVTEKVVEIQGGFG